MSATRRARRERDRSNGARSRDLSPDAREHLLALQQAQNEASIRYREAAVLVVKAMNIGQPREGHQWVVDPAAGKIVELPLPPQPSA